MTCNGVSAPHASVKGSRAPRGVRPPVGVRPPIMLDWERSFPPNEILGRAPFQFSGTASVKRASRQACCAGAA